MYLVEEFAVQFSLGDALQILDDPPLQPDTPTQTTFVQISNRVPIVHLAIERGLKFLIKKHGGEFLLHHDLHKHLRQLREFDRTEVEFLEKIFDDATEFYGLNPNHPGLGHLRSLNAYLETVGTAKAFDRMRYWELNPEQEESLFRKVWPTIHREILLAIIILCGPNSSDGQTIKARVERTVREALLPPVHLAFSPGSDHEATVRRYIDWVLSHPSCQEALNQAFQQDFVIGDEFMNRMVSEAFHSLNQLSDPAIRYLLSRMDVLPPQPRDVIPRIEWSDPPKKQTGKVLTPGGTILGYIQRAQDGIWHTFPLRVGTEGKIVRARTRTDAQCYLAQLLSDTCMIKVNDEPRTIRLVGEPPSRVTENHGRMRDSIDSVPWTHRLVCWESGHGIESDDTIRVELPSRGEQPIIHAFEGQVTLTIGSEIFIEGKDVWVVVTSS